MHIFHKQLLTAIKTHAGMGTSLSSNTKYLGNSHFFYSISAPIKQDIVKKWVKEHKNISSQEFIVLLTSLISAPSYEEKTVAGLLLGYMGKQRKELGPQYLDKWLEQLTGWAEIDSLCQSSFSVNEIIGDWNLWSKILREFALSMHISKRRASLVLLTKAVSRSSDVRFMRCAFTNIDILKYEKDILITKAISWLLRSMVKNHKEAVNAYIEKNIDILPKIVVRETKHKIQTGKKNKYANHHARKIKYGSSQSKSDQG